MRFTWWLNSLFRFRGKSSVKQRARRILSLEQLESRLAPASFVWTGGGGAGNTNWSNAANWQNGIVPTGLAANNEDLVFGPSGTSSLISNNDLPTSGNVLPIFDSITFSDNGYTLKGKAIQLGSPSESGGITVSGSGETISLNMTVGKPAVAGDQVFTVNGGSDLTISGQISGAANLDKAGNGLLVLGGDNVNETVPFSGVLKVDQNSGILEITNQNALGKGATDVEVNSQLQINNTSGNPWTIANNLSVVGQSSTNDGVILNQAGTNKLTGTTTLFGNTTIGAAGNTSLEFAGPAGPTVNKNAAPAIISYQSASYEITKAGPGTAIFSAPNTYNGNTHIQNGILDIQNPNALSNGGPTQYTVDTTYITGLQEEGTLMLDDPANDFAGGFTVANEVAALDGLGFNNPAFNGAFATINGAMYNNNGDNIWTGPVLLGTPFPPSNQVYIGVAFDQSLTISGVISDPHKTNTLTKQDDGTLIFTNNNTYDDATVVNAGVLEIEDSHALGSTAAASGTTVNAGATLELAIDNRQSFTPLALAVDSVTGTKNSLLLSEPLIISGTGLNNVGALFSHTGYNTWSTPITFGNVETSIGVDPDPNATSTQYDVNTQVAPGQNITTPYSVTDQSLTITAALNSTVQFDKVGFGQLILPNPNIALTGNTDIQAGYVTIEDPAALGPFQSAIGQNAQVTVSVESNAALHLLPIGKNEVQTINVANPNPIAGGYFTLTFGAKTTGHILYDANPNNLAGNIQTQLNSLSNINGGVTVVSAGGGNYTVTFVNNLAQTNVAQLSPTFVGTLGGAGANVTVATTVQGAAGHWNFTDNLKLNGLGITTNSSPYALIVQQGAVMNLAGINTLSGNLSVTDQVGIGVEQVYTSSQLLNYFSQLTVTGSIGQQSLTTIPIPPTSPNGSGAEKDNRINVRSTAGTAVIDCAVHGAPDDVRFYIGKYSVGNPNNAVLVYDSTTNGNYKLPNNKNGAQVTVTWDETVGTATATAVEMKDLGDPVGTFWTLGPVVTNFAPLAVFPTWVTIVLNQDGNPKRGTVWTYKANITPTSPKSDNGIIKLGSQRLILQGDGIYTGDVDVQQGVLRAQSNTALGTDPQGSSSTTTVEVGAALELAASNPGLTGGVNAGLQINNEKLVLNGTGNAAFGDAAPLVVMNANDLANDPTYTPGNAATAGIPMAGDFLWNGPVSLNTSADTVSITFQGAGVSLGSLYAVTATGLTPGFTATGSGLGSTQTITFGGSLVEGNFFNLTFNGTTTAPLIWYSNPTTLADTIQAALDQLIGPGDTLVAPAGIAGPYGVIDIRSGSRLSIAGTIDDSANTDINGSDLSVISTNGGPPLVGLTGAGGSGPNGELILSGVNTYHGSTYAPAGVVLVVADGQALGTSGNAEVQTLTIAGAVGTQFALSFNGASTPPITYMGTPADAGNIQAALQALTTIGGVSGNAVVNQTGNGVFTITLGGNLSGFHQALITTNNLQVTVSLTADGGGGTVVANGSALELEGNIAVAGEPVLVQGSGLAASPKLPYRWFQQGPAPILGTPTENPQTGKTTGRVTSIAVDSTDSTGATIYVTTADGGAWKTVNGGQTWQQMFDAFAANGTPIYAGSIVVDPNDPFVLYLGTGEADNLPDAFAGTGVYMSTDAGQTWTQLGGAANPLVGSAVSKVIVDPTSSVVGTPSTRIYVATSDLAQNSVSGTAAIWRYDNNGWFNLIANAVGGGPVDDPNKTLAGAPAYAVATRNVLFPANSAVWSDVALVTQPGLPNSGWLMAALGTPSPGPQTTNNNGIYYSSNPTANNPNWFIGDMRNELGDPTGPVNWAAGNIKITVVPGTGKVEAGITDFTSGGLLNVYEGVTGATPGGNVFNGSIEMTWTKVSKVTNYLGTSGNAYSAITSIAGTTVYYGGQATGVATNIEVGTPGTTSDISSDGANSPPSGVLALAPINVSGVAEILAATVGGLYLYNPTAPALWTSINGNMAVTQFNAIAGHPTNPDIAFGGSQNNGVEQFTGAPSWKYVDSTAAANILGSGAQIDINPNNPKIVYALTDPSASAGGIPKTQPGTLYQSTNSGAAMSWVQFPNAATNNITGFALDQADPNRLLLGGGNNVTNLRAYLMNSFGVIQTVQNLNAPFGPTLIAPAAYQGPFPVGGEPGFPSITDQGPNTYVPNTIYISDGTNIRVTMVGSSNWTPRNLPVAPGKITSLVVDPTNMNVVYATRSVNGGKEVYQTTNAGVTWADISNNLPTVDVWKLVIDPRGANVVNPYGTLYVGNDYGVYQGTFDGVSWNWAPVGNGLPTVAVHDLDLNLTLNTLSAGTYGRSMYTFYLDGTQAAGGALTAVSGNVNWTGPIILAGPTTISAQGTQALQNGLAAASLTINGSISDQTYNAQNKLIKTGNGNVDLAGTNTYTGLTDIQQGVVIVDSFTALGSNVNGTTVETGTALELRSSLNAEPITLNGNGIQYNGHFTGALRSIANTNTYTGTITLNTDSTIGVDQNSTLTIGDGMGNGTITQTSPFSFVKELTGTLILADADSYGNPAGTVVVQNDPTSGLSTSYPGGTVVAQGLLEVLDSASLGVNGGTTTVLDGAQLELQSSSGLNIHENLQLTGAGISSTGALYSLSGNNTINGIVTLAKDGNFQPATTPPATATIGVFGAANTVTITGQVGQTVPVGLTKIGPGTLDLQQIITYANGTIVQAGTLTLEASGAYGSIQVNNAAELDLKSGLIGQGAITLNGTGVGGKGALYNATGNNTWSGGAGNSIILASNSTIGAAFGTNLTVGATIMDPSPLVPPAASLTVAGLGTVALSGANSYTGKTFVTGTLEVENNAALGGTTSGTEVDAGGTLQVDATFDITPEPLTIKGGTVSGAGTVGNLSPTATGGTIAPTGSTLTSNTGASADTWNGATTFFVNLDDAGPSSKLTLLGNGINLGNAKLTGVVVNSAIGDQFVILQSDNTINGNFNLPLAGFVFIGNHKYSVTIDNSSLVKTVTLTDVPNNFTPPTITQVPNQSMVENTVLVVNFTAQIGNTPFTANQLTVNSVSSSNQSVVANSGIVASSINSSGKGTLTITPVSNQTGIINITFTVSDPYGLYGTDSFQLTVGNPPAFTSAAGTTFTVGSAGSFTVMASGFPAPTLSGSSALPSGVTFVAATGILSGTPAALTGGTYNLKFTAANGIGSNATQNFVLTVDEAPAITSVNSATFTAGVAGSFTVTTTGFPKPTFSESGPLPNGVTLNASTGVLSGTPAPNSGGVYNFVITASNGVGADATQAFTLTVGQMPAITSANAITFTAGTLGNFAVVATGFPTPTLSQSGALPGGVTFNSGTGQLSGTPALGTGGTYSLVFSATNGAGTATQNFTLTVNAAPVFTSATSTGFAVGTAGTFTVTASGFPAPTFTESGLLPSGVTFNVATHKLAGTPAAGTTGTYNIMFTASNSAGSVTQNFTLNVGQAPAFTSAGSAAFTEGTAASFGVTANSTPAPTITESGVLPTGITFNGSVLAGTPAANSHGIYNLVFTAANGIGTNATQNFTLTVQQTPVITSAGSATFAVGVSNTFTVMASGFPAPTFIRNGTLPTGVTFNTTTGVLSGIPAAGTVGTYNLVFTAMNGAGSSTPQNFTLTVGQAPAFTSAASKVFQEGVLGSFTVSASGVPAPTLSLVSGGLPTGVNFIPGNGLLSGTPAAGSNGIYNLVFSANNGVGAGVTQNFTLTVKQAPAFTSANSVTFSVGSPNSFTVSASGYPAPTFTRSGTLPAGVTFNATTGILSGTPTVAGTFNEIFTASNGALPNATQSFVLTVVPALSFSPALTNKTYSHTVGTVNLSGASNKPGATYALSITTASPAVPGTFSANIDSGTGAITITGFSKYAGTVNFKEIASLGSSSISQTFSVTFTNNPPVLGTIADQTMVHGTTKTVTLSYSDLDTPTDTLTPTFSAAPYSQLYNLQQQLNLYVAGTSANPYFFNLYHKNEKWLKSHKDSNWYALVVVSGNTYVYAFSGSPVNPFGTLKGIFTGTSLYNNPLLLVNASPPSPVNVNFSFNPITKVLSMMPTPSTFTGQFQVTVTLSDGITSVSKMFVVTVT